MSSRLLILVLSLAILATGCATSPQMVKDNQPAAIQAALDRSRVDLGCQNPHANVLSHEAIVPQVGSGGWVEGGRKTAYQILVTGCEKSGTFTVNCTDMGMCTATMNQANPGASPTKL
jgi:hypothetical protein